MFVNSVYIVCGLVLLPVGAHAVVRGSAALAYRLGVTALAIGLTVVAFGTGSPELVLGIEAARGGNSGIALGTVIGSNIANIVLGLGFAALARPMTVRSELIRREVPVMIGVTLLMCAMLLDGKLTRAEGLALLVGAVAYTVSSYLVAKRGARAVAAQFDRALAPPKRPAYLDVATLSVGIAALLVGAHLLLEGSVFVAERLGIDQVVIGLTIIAVGTSLPELATSITAAIRDEADVAFGNAIGSNVLNILAVLGVVAVIRPFEVHGLRTLDLVVMVASSMLLLPLLWRGADLNRWEGAGLLVAYAAYLWSLAP